MKLLVVPVKCKLDAAGNCMDLDRNGSFDGYPDALQQAPTSLVRRTSHGPVRARVHLSQRKGFVQRAFDAKGDPVREYLPHYGLGVDGVFSDAADTALYARERFEREMSRWARCVHSVGDSNARTLTR